MIIPTLLVTVGLVALAHTAEDWNYHKGEVGGPEYWKTLQKNCAGSGQSPVSIEEEYAKYDQALYMDKFKFYGYDGTDDMKFRLGNNGHTVQVVVEADNRYITGGGLPGRYNLLQIHWHWGSNNHQGSEHSVNDHFYPMEIHWVHYYYKYNVSQALVAPDGLAVLGFFFEIDDHEYNEAFDRIVDHFENVKYKDEEIYISPVFELNSLFPRSMDKFYRYKGSLTTPGCYESVFWTVFEKPIKISQKQMDTFRTLMEHGRPQPGDPHDESHLSDNFRPIQKLNDRVIYTNMKMSISLRGGATYHVAFVWVLAPLITSFVCNYFL